MPRSWVVTALDRGFAIQNTRQIAYCCYSIAILPFCFVLNAKAPQKRWPKKFWAENCVSDNKFTAVWSQINVTVISIYWCVYVVQCATNLAVLLLMFLCFSFLFMLCESSSKPEIARNVWFDFFCWSVLIFHSLSALFPLCISHT